MSLTHEQINEWLDKSANGVRPRLVPEEIEMLCFLALDGLELRAENERLREALEKLARLGNGERYGNSEGNTIARRALERKPE